MKPHVKQDSYDEFLRYFHISKQDFFDWGLSSTIFPETDKVASEWENLKERIQKDQTVHIRGYGRDAHGTKLYLELYRHLFHNSHVEKDASNNTQPHRLIRQLTGLKRNYNVYNYQVSHIWGRTKNIFLFEAPWNLCYTPKIIDPFTGHETQGPWGIEYKELFLSRARERYQPFLDDYNKLLETLNLLPRVQEYLLSLHDILPEKEWTQFSKDVLAELSPIR